MAGGTVADARVRTGRTGTHAARRVTPSARGSFGAGVLRTLQRRIRQWRAEHGHEQEVFFAQHNPPGRQAFSDFTVCNELAVTIAGAQFDHRLYQFALAYSGWRHAELVCGGE